MKTEEDYLYDVLVMLRESYEKAAAPYIKRLVEINSLRSPAPVLMPPNGSSRAARGRRKRETKMATVKIDHLAEGLKYAERLAGLEDLAPNEHRIIALATEVRRLRMELRRSNVGKRRAADRESEHG